MRSSISYEPDPEIKRTFLLRRKKQRIEEQRREARRNSNMAGGEGDRRRTLRDFIAPRVQGIASSIACSVVDANNFELKPALISMVHSHFGVAPFEDPKLHLSVFLEVCDTLMLNGVSSDAIRLCLFPFSLSNKARAWLLALPSWCITTWDELTRAFLTKFFPPSRTACLRNQITNFMQKDDERSIKPESVLKICCVCAPIMVFSIGWLSKPFTMAWPNL